MQKEKQETIQNNLKEIKSLLEEGSYKDANEKAWVFIQEKDYKNNKNSKNKNICKLYAKTLKKCGDSEDNLNQKFGVYEKYISFIDYKKALFGNDFGNNEDKSFIYTKLAEIRLDPQIVVIKGDSAETILEYAEEALKIDKDSTDARKYKSIALNKQGKQFFESGDYESAIKKYTEAIQNQPNIADSYFYKSKAQYALNDHEAAIQTIQYAQKIDSNNAQYKELKDLIINEQVHTLCSKGEQNYQNAQYQASLNNYKKASKCIQNNDDCALYIQNNDDCAFRVLRAEAYLSLSKDERVEAKDFFVKALEIKPADHRCNVEIVKLLIVFAEFKEANTYLSNIKTINTDEFKDLKSKIKNGLDQDTVNSSIDQLLAMVPSIYLNDLSENINNDQNESEVASLGGITIVDSAEFT